MAQRIQTLFIDDIDGSEAEGTVRFGLDGASYEIDLNAKHAEALRSALGRYVEAARRASKSANGTSTRQRDGLRRDTRERSADSSIRREYLRLLGHQVNERGRLPAELKAIQVPPRNQWPNAEHDEPVGSIEDDKPAEAVLKSPGEIASEAADAIMTEQPAETKPVKGASGYDKEFRDKAVRATMAEGATLAGVAKELGISEGSLRNWRKTALAAEAAASTLGASTSARRKPRAAK